MTLRGRLTTAFLAMVLGPVLLGAFSVGVTLTTVGQHRSQERLDLAASAVRASVGELCARLRTVAGAVAVLQDASGRAGTAARLVAQGLASSVLGTDAAGAPTFATAGGPLWPWADCASGGAAAHIGAHAGPDTGPVAVPGAGPDAGPEARPEAGPGIGPEAGPGADASGPAIGPAPGAGPAEGISPVPGTRSAEGAEADPGVRADQVSGPRPGAQPGAIRALAAQVEFRDGTGTVAGTISAAQRLDGDFVTRLAAATGTGVTLLRGDGPDGVAHSTEPVGTRDAVVTAVARGGAGAGTRSAGGRYVRRVGPTAGQPLPLVLSVPRDPPQTLYAVLLGAVALAGLLAVFSGWRLARSTTRPLAELARAADQAASGNLAARASVRSPDEVGRLAAAVNRMTRTMESYVAALTCSRDQLRRHLAVLGDTLASTHDLQRILRVILQNARAATGARAGVLLLLDRATGEPVGRCAEGLGDEEVSGLLGSAADLLGLDAGLLGAVAATGESRRGRIAETGGSGEPKYRTYVAVPFPVPGTGGGGSAAAEEPAAPGPPPGGGERSPRSSGPDLPAAGTMGVLALYDRLGGDEFDDTDLVTLRAFASHAAVAVANVRVHEEAQRLSLTDPLTGLWNYRYLKESIRREVERANRFGRMLSVLALDLDRFKEVNDSFGHAAGDAVLVEFARRIRGVVREVDLVFRQGGEEFVVLLPETDARGAATVAERLGAAVRATPIAVRPPPGAAATRTAAAGGATAGPPAGRRPAGRGPGGDPSGTVAAPVAAVAVTVSIGIAVYPDHGSTGTEVLDTADDALYAAKAAGRDTYRVAAGRLRTTVPDQPADEALPADARRDERADERFDGRVGERVVDERRHGRVGERRDGPVGDEIPVPAGAVSPADGMPWAGYRPRTG